MTEATAPLAALKASAHLPSSRWPETSGQSRTGRSESRILTLQRQRGVVVLPVVTEVYL
jgi:hypothetical protein